VNIPNTRSAGATAFNANIARWNVAKVTKMSTAFKDATVFNADISSWNVASVNDMY
jgi:surface protein